MAGNNLTFKAPHIYHAIWWVPIILAGCSAPPNLPARNTVTGAETTPQLLPITVILAQTAEGPHTARLTDTAPEARAGDLRARAAVLRAPVLPDETRMRMQGSGAGLR